MAEFYAQQWDFFLKNLGEWHGSFAKFLPNGEAIDELPTVVAVTETDSGQVQVHVDYLTDQDRNVTWTFGSVPGDMTFFEGGEFSRGDKWLHGLSNAGFEQGLIQSPRRVRLVQVYKAGQLEKVVLICEQLQGASIPVSPRLTVDDLVGNWTGEAVTLSAKSPEPMRYPTQLQVQVNGDRLSQQITFGNRTLISTARIDGSMLHFEDGGYPVHLLLLPGGVSSNCPQHIPSGQPFVVELGWLIAPGFRQRIIRSYDKSGNRESTTLVSERRT